MHQGDYTSAPYYQFPHMQQNPNPIPNPTPPQSDPIPNHYASAPPFTPNYDYSSTYSPYPPHNPDHVPSSNPSFNPPPFESSNPLYQQPSQPYYPPYDQQHQTPLNYAPPNPNPNLYNSSPYSVPPIPSYETSYENPVKSGGGGGAYFDDRYGGSFNRRNSDLGSELYGKRHDGGLSRYESVGGGGDEGYGDGVYAYEGGKVEPYGARGTASKSSTWNSSSTPSFDDFGRPISFSSPKESSVASKIVKAVPKVDTQDDVKSGVQKFRVKLLAESGGQSTMDVLCQVGLDGLRMLDPNTSRTLRIYPLENITRCDRFDSSTFAFWSKSPVDIEPRRIRLQSNSYTTNTLLDTVTAATIQFKEMGGSRRPAESFKTNEQPAERKKGLGDWMNIIKPANEEKDHWVPDEAVSKCTACGTDFGAFIRKHHCRNCGDIFCDKCTHGRIALTAEENAQPVRVCDRCMAEVTQRLSSAKESSNKPLLQSHEDMARKLQEELERNRKTSGSKSDGSGKRMKEVACPICTVHLQVQVPSSGSETIECGVCQHPFLVSSY
ncbi:putative chromatin regulator PHD family [Medicago truncatula]|nr:protein FREE1 [Medicago truncatula]AES74028.1 RING/FYVE/PHD-type zinc finger protein [Medicago truncatula]RHN71129.1 putative chromatin regulator PHD family [Medicago truncatula]